MKRQIKFNKIIKISILISILFFPCYKTASAGTFNMPPYVLGLQSGLKGWWTFDGADVVQNVADRSGNGNHGYYTLYNNGNAVATSSLQVMGKVGQALKFNGVDQCIDAGAGSSINITGAITVSAWVLIKDTLAQRVIASKSGLGGAGANQQYALYESSSNRFAFAVTNSTTISLSSITASATIANNVWVHIVGTYDGIDTTRMYLNGVQVDSDTSAGYGTLQDSGKNLEIGGTNGSKRCNGAFFSGQIDDVRIYNRALSADEILQLYNMGSGNRSNTSSSPGSLSSGLIQWWTFDGKDTISSFNNSISGGLALTNFLGNESVSSVDIGVIGRGLKCLGGAGRVYTGASTLAIPSSVSISFWMRFDKSFQKTIDGLFGWGGIGARFGGVANSKLNFYVDGGSGGSATTASTITDNKWHHILLTSSSNAQVLYLDGAQTGTASETLDSSTSGISICNPSGGSTGFNGLMDDVRIYNRVLSASEALQLYNMGAGNHMNVSSSEGNLSSGLVGWWTMDGKDMAWTSATAGTITDKSTTGNIATLSNMKNNTDVVPGVIGQGIVTGNNKTITVTANNAINPSTITMAFWLYLKGCPKDNNNSFWRSGSSNYNRLRLSACVSGKYTIQWINSNATNNTNVLYTLYPSTWYHFTFVGDSSGLKVYENGTLNASEGTATAYEAIPPVVANYTLGMGSGYPYAILDDYRIYNRALTSDEIKQLYNMGR